MRPSYATLLSHPWLIEEPAKVAQSKIELGEWVHNALETNRKRDTPKNAKPTLHAGVSDFGELKNVAESLASVQICN